MRGNFPRGSSPSTINSISAKFDKFQLMVSGYFDVIILAEAKLDDSFPKAQFCIDGFSIPYRLDRNENGGGLVIYVRDDIPSKTLKNITILKILKLLLLS